jgi:hypothetical protein
MSSLGLFMRVSRSVQKTPVTSHVMLVSRAILNVPYWVYTLLDDDGVASLELDCAKSLELSGATALEFGSAAALELEITSVPESDDVTVSDDPGSSGRGLTELSLSPPQLAQKSAAEESRIFCQCLRIFIFSPC